MKLTIIENIEVNSDKGRILLEKGDKIDINTTINESKMIAEAMPGAFKGMPSGMMGAISIEDLPEIGDFQGPSTDPIAGPSGPAVQPTQSSDFPGMIAHAMTAEPQSMLAVAAPTTPVQSAGPDQSPVPPASTTQATPAAATTPDNSMSAVANILNGLIGQLLSMGDQAKPLLDSLRAQLGQGSNLA